MAKFVGSGTLTLDFGVTMEGETGQEVFEKMVALMSEHGINITIDNQSHKINTQNLRVEWGELEKVDKEDYMRNEIKATDQ